MEYTIKALAKISNISTRTLRYYHEIGLLKPKRINSSGYRIYGKNEVELLQKILFYKEINFELKEIKEAINNPNFDFISTLINHKKLILKEQSRLSKLLENINNTLEHIKGDYNMPDKDRFEGFKKELIEENEKRYGKEIREKYGDDIINKNNKKLLNVSQEEFIKIQKLEEDVKKQLIFAMEHGDYTTDEAQKLIDLHMKWISNYNEYSNEAYLTLTQMYVDDERFAKYYNDVKEGGAVFLSKAAMHFLNN